MNNKQKRALAWLKIHQDAYGNNGSGSIVHVEPEERREEKPTRKGWFVRGSNKKN